MGKEKETKMSNELKRTLAAFNRKSKWKLQLFAEEPDGGGADPNGGEADPNGGESDGEGDSNDDESKEPKDGEKKYTDAEVDEIVEKKFARWKEQTEKELKDARAEAEKLAKMNADQKKDYELEKIKAENARLRAEAARIELGKEATKILKESKIDATQDILDFVVGEDADSTKANIDKFVGIINSQLKAAEVERATGKTPKSYNNDNRETDEILKRIKKYE